ncbi:E3 ubiquitin-protein ligase listerin [Colletotrichum chlorophyti]|uniref:E3 ubiquitin-protein ligase listerin n=1 Tax=Colletotrichum chlorophyti TaxID=708187 RepID=A0A1Q8S305_9PEZI|nr:E3 ubiquitin-protein ligase listerin [Colletotrichum chlorophyti]
MSRVFGKGSRSTGAKGFGSPARGFGGFSSTSSGNGLSYLAEPPDLSSISDANVVVSFKNALKKDATTKAKALEELLAYVQAHPFEKDGGTEEAVLEAWVQIYPRISIDNSRRVRELSHTLQFELMKSARKRMEKHVPKIVGTWLAGLYDKDRVVSRAANDGLSSFLSSPEKVALFWKKCQPQILTYATDAIQETQDTLSDERSTTPDDAEAKYLRVVGASLSLVLGLLQKLETADTEKEVEAYDAFFAEEKAWKSATMADASVRRSACQLLWACLDKRPDSVSSQISRLKKIFVAEGLKSNQTGSAVEYVRVLTKLTTKFPEIWTSSGEKKTPMSRLNSFLEKGSQGSSVRFWEYLEQLIKAIPSEHFSVDASADALKSLRTGITNREEPRMNAPTAWTCYVHIAKQFLQNLPSDGPRARLVQENIFPLLEHFLFPTPENSVWEIGGSGRLAVLSEAYGICADTSSSDLVQATTEKLEELSSAFCTRISNSLPEVSKDYEKSQEAISAEANSWFTLIGQVQNKYQPSTTGPAHLFTDPSKAIIKCSLSLLANRNLKPFGAAGVVYNVAKNAPRVWEDPEAAQVLEEFLLNQGRDRMDMLMASRSASDLVSCVTILGSLKEQQAAYTTIWETWVDALLNLPDERLSSQGIERLIGNPNSSHLSKAHNLLQKFIEEKCSSTARGDSDAWSLFEAALVNDAVTESTAQQLAVSSITALSENKEHAAQALRALEIIANNKPGLLSQDEATHMAVVTELLGLAELEDRTVSSRAISLRALLEQPSDGKSPLVAIIQRNLEDAGPQSLSVDTLVQQALQASKTGAVSLEDLFPSTNVWMQQLSNFLKGALNPSLSITSSLAGAHFLLRPDEEPLRIRARRDRDGYSIPARMASYTSKLLFSDISVSTLPESFQVELLYLLCISVQMVSDQITLADDNKLFLNLATGDALASAESFVSSTRSTINSIINDATGWRDGSESGSTHLVNSLITIMTQETKELTSLGLYSSRALSELLQNLTEKHGLPAPVDVKINQLATFRATPATILAAAGVLTGFGETLESSKTVNNLCNRLVSDVAGASVESDKAEKALLTLVLLNACLQVYEVGEIPVANNRIVFAVRQITSWLDDTLNLTPSLSAEICRALQRLLPNVKDVYGPHWEKTIEFSTSLWAKASDDRLDASLPYIHTSLKLMTALETLSEPNDDLVDALKEFAETKSLSLIELLKLTREKSTQPLEIVDGILCRQVNKIPLKHISDLSDLYGLIAADSRSIQTAAFNILHYALPAQQEELSVNVLLDKTDARLPDELLSLLLDAPTLERYPDELLAEFPVAIRSYLLSWHLIFDAFSSASLKVRNDYTEHLKTENYIAPLLNFTFDVLGHSAAHPLNLEREGLTTQHITSYDLSLADAEPEERNLHWLLVHLYYLTLKYTPGLFKTWYLDCRSKQTRIAVEAWMTRYFSPIIIADALDEVAAWAASQDAPEDDEKELVVKVSRASREITAGYEVDESMASIAIKVPASYPIEGVNVVGINRVAVNERKWQSWLLTTQGVITFSNGSIVDGLSAFRRNIVGALKGQSECAICYSIISTDKKMPDKRCGTCKNLFHRTCLYKWFQTSSQNTCPLCRNPIDYLGSDTKARRGA